MTEQTIDWSALYHSTDPVDWSGELVAIHPDGRVVEVTKATKATIQNAGESTEYYQVLPNDFDGWAFCFNPDGTHDEVEWRVRNRKPKQPRIAPEVVERMVKVVRLCADDSRLEGGALQSSAKEILAQIEPPVDPDRALVDAVIAGHFPNAADPNVWAMRRVALDAVKRLRAELAKRTDGEASHEQG